MVEVTIHRKDNEQIVAYRVSGHADYATSGKDIVCAGVSSVVVGTVNAIEALLSVRLEHNMEKGLLTVKIPDVDEKMLSENIQLLLESMLVMLKTIEQSYGKYIRINIITI